MAAFHGTLAVAIGHVIGRAIVQQDFVQATIARKNDEKCKSCLQ